MTSRSEHARKLNSSPTHQQTAGYGSVRARKAKAKDQPTIKQRMLRDAVAKLGWRHIRPELELWNPYATGKNGLAEGAPQWLDIVAVTPKGIIAVDLKDHNNPTRDERYQEEKRLLLGDRGIHYIYLRGGTTTATFVNLLTLEVAKI